jgi:hypothetical protein
MKDIWVLSKEHGILELLLLIRLSKIFKEWIKFELRFLYA